MICLINSELNFTYLARGSMARKKMARIQASLPYKKQTNLVYLFYLADLRKKK